MPESYSRLRLVQPVEQPVAESKKFPFASYKEEDIIPEHLYNYISVRKLQNQTELLLRPLSFRDAAIIQSVYECRAITSQQLQKLYFTTSSTENNARLCRSVLLRLSKTEYLERFDRSIGGFRAGSGSFIYTLGPASKYLFGSDNSHKQPPFNFRSGHHLLNHTLTIAEVYVNLHEWSRQGSFNIAELETEPKCWRVFGNMYVTETLKPDMYIVISAPHKHDYHIFLEIDRATHYAKALEQKAELYYYYSQYGDESDEKGCHPITVWTSPSDKRAEFISSAIKPISKRLPQLFESIAIDQLHNFLKSRLAPLERKKNK